MRPALPELGLGIGWRPELALAIDRRAELGFVELVAESLDPSAPLPAPVARLRERGVRMVLHGLSLSLGGTDPLDLRRLDALARLAERTGACVVSEHVCFVRAAGLHSGHLLPLPRTRASLDVLVENVRKAASILPVPLALENIAALVEWPEPELDEPAFLGELLARTDTWLLLDVANLHANARNHGWDAAAYLERLPVERIAYVHLAGGVQRGGLYHDTHAHPLPPEPLELLERLCARITPPGMMLERDGRFPPDAELNAELDAIATAARRGEAGRRAA